jgi:hypothetical protein
MGSLLHIKIPNYATAIAIAIVRTEEIVASISVL